MLSKKPLKDITNQLENSLVTEEQVTSQSPQESKKEPPIVLSSSQSEITVQYNQDLQDAKNFTVGAGAFQFCNLPSSSSGIIAQLPQALYNE